MFDYYFRRHALRLGAIHFALTVLLITLPNALGSWGIEIANVLRYPMVLAIQRADGISIPVTLQWSLLILNSLWWGFALVWLTRKVRRHWFLYRLSREAKRRQREASKYQL